MSSWTKRSRVLAGLGLMLLGPTAAYTFTLLSPTRHWASTPVTVCVEGPGHMSITANDLDRGVTATIQALNNTHSNLAGTGWNVTPVGPVVNAVLVDTNSVNAGLCNSSWTLGDGKPTIAFTDRVKGACAGSCLAVTFTGYYSCDPLLPDNYCVIHDADVQTRKNTADKYGGPYYSLYESNCTSGREWNIEAIMVHEVGHVLGLGHSDVQGSTMYPSVSSCNSNPATINANPATTASNDDALALDALY